MNERIEGLWWQARIGYNNQNCDPEVLAKFAELIVRECARVYWNIDDGETHSEYVNALKQHFGVEE